jgi:hypothetical protein
VGIIRRIGGVGVLPVTVHKPARAKFEKCSSVEDTHSLCRQALSLTSLAQKVLEATHGGHPSTQNVVPIKAVCGAEIILRGELGDDGKSSDKGRQGDIVGEHASSVSIVTNNPKSEFECTNTKDKGLFD